MRYLAASLLTAAAFGQNFEVASVKPSSPVSVGMDLSTDPGRFTASNVTLKFLVQAAYRVKDFQISGGPKWFDSARFDIVAKMPAGFKEEDYRPPLQALLADRFQLSFHRESRMQAGYELTVGKTGLKIKEVPKSEGGARTGKGRISAKSISFAQLAALLANALGSAVVDKTGVGGLFDVELRWTPDERDAVTAKPEAMASEGDTTGHSLFTALQEQVGLKLEARTAPVEILVIDGAQMPKGN